MAFGTSVAKGARIDNESDPGLQQKGIAVVRDFCRRTKINLAGIDVLFNENDGRNPHPLLLEINYFFGRTGIGGSEVFYTLLQEQIDRWLKKLGFSIHQNAGEQKDETYFRRLG
jgi:ribosomal protein S6--L-glutamate ligase